MPKIARSRLSGRVLPNPSFKLSPTACRAGHHALGLRPIVRMLSSAPHRWRQLSSNVRHHKTQPVASPAGSAARSAEDQTATARHSRVQLAPLIHLLGVRKYRAKRCPPVMKQQVTLPSFQLSASRKAAVALGAGFVSQFLEAAAVRSAVASFSLVRGGRQIRGRPAWSARSGLPSFLFTEVSGPSGTLPVFPLPHTVLPNPSFKPSPNSVPRRPASAGPAAHHALAGQRVTLSVPA